MTEGTLPAETTVGRVALRVADRDDVGEFYQTVVGLDVLDAGRETTVLGAGGAALLVLEDAPDAPARRRAEAGLFHAAVRVPTRAALGDALERITDRWTLDGASDHLVSEALYCRDPEGNGVEVYWDRPRTEWPTDERGRVRMTTAPLDRESLRELGGGDDAVPPGTDVGHVHLEVTDVDRSRAFYVDALGLNVRQAWGESALFVAGGDYHHHVGLNTWNGRSAPLSGRGLGWFELVVPDDETVGGVADRCEGAGYDVRRIDGPGADAVDVRNSGGVEVRGPDGISVRIVPAGSTD